jgi:lysophospholipase L1-like esterase
MPITTSESQFYDLVNSGSEYGATPKYKVLAEGDSWFSHPFLSHLIKQIDDLGDDEFAILNLAEPGDTAKGMFEEGSKQLKRLGQLIQTERYGYTFDLIIISAGGNDIVGPEILDFVDPYFSEQRTGADLINDKFNEIIDNIRRQYKNILELRNQSDTNHDTPVIGHGYAFLKPRKVGTKLFGAMFGNGWVKQYLDQLEIPQSDQQLIINEMLNRFHHAVKSLENEYQQFLFVDTRKTLMKSNGKPKVSLFHDEIHPKGRGFRKVAKKIAKQAKQKNLWPG